MHAVNKLIKYLSDNMRNGSRNYSNRILNKSRKKEDWDLMYIRDLCKI